MERILIRGLGAQRLRMWQLMAPPESGERLLRVEACASLGRMGLSSLVSDGLNVGYILASRTFSMIF